MHALYIDSDSPISSYVITTQWLIPLYFTKSYVATGLERLVVGGKEGSKDGFCGAFGCPQPIQPSVCLANAVGLSVGQMLQAHAFTMQALAPYMWKLEVCLHTAI